MSGEFLGTFTTSVNKGKWVTIPATFKKKFSPQSKQTVIITVGSESNLAIYPLDNWQEKIGSLENGEEKDRKMLITLRHFAAAEQKMEPNGRIKISDDLLDLFPFDEKVIIKGEGKFISIWKPEAYKAYSLKLLEEHRSMFNSLDYQ
ncbi:MAG TPA: protein MraZ [Candidatus Cloacimonadota bacterium]|nr:protein MraZ [Candidatus Cloacimonadota bacterium]